MFKVIRKSKFNDEVLVSNEFESKKEVEKAFLDVASVSISNFDEYDFEEIETILEQGYENFGSGTVYIEENGLIPKGVQV